MGPDCCPVDLVYDPGGGMVLFGSPAGLRPSLGARPETPPGTAGLHLGSPDPFVTNQPGLA
jgi:hypothetical protein